MTIDYQIILLDGMNVNETITENEDGSLYLLAKIYVNQKEWMPSNMHYFTSQIGILKK